MPITEERVTKVIDGDTFEASGGPPVRLANVNAPEINTQKGQKAKRDLEGLIGGKTVSIEQVGTSYGRRVAEVKIGSWSINQAMKSKL